jgi:6-pyruvoyltetrahydropterin/6-carboxytetrahydropterin synthase
VSRFRLAVEAHFEAAHHLRSYRGAPETPHGHSWRVSVELAADRLDDEGMAFDFVPARAALVELAARFDHRDLNAVAPFDRISPTTEQLAVWFCEEMQRRLPDAHVVSATVWEGPACRATYFSDVGYAR